MPFPTTATDAQIADLIHARNTVVADLQSLLDAIQKCPASQLWDALQAARAESDHIGHDLTYPDRFPVNMGGIKAALDAVYNAPQNDEDDEPKPFVSAAWGCSSPFDDYAPQENDAPALSWEEQREIDDERADRFYASVEGADEEMARPIY